MSRTSRREFLASATTVAAATAMTFERGPVLAYAGTYSVPAGANLRILEVTEIKSDSLRAAFAPPVERLIGTIRREYLDRILFWTTADLEAKLIDFQYYYNGHRTYAGLEARLPEPPAGGTVSPTGLDSYRWPETLSRVVPNSHSRLILLISPCAGSGVVFASQNRGIGSLPQTQFRAKGMILVIGSALACQNKV